MNVKEEAIKKKNRSWLIDRNERMSDERKWREKKKGISFDLHLTITNQPYIHPILLFLPCLPLLELA